MFQKRLTQIICIILSALFILSVAYAVIYTLLIA